jgi:hypothetical protein
MRVGISAKIRQSRRDFANFAFVEVFSFYFEQIRAQCRMIQLADQNVWCNKEWQSRLLIQQEVRGKRTGNSNYDD